MPQQHSSDDASRDPRPANGRTLARPPTSAGGPRATPTRRRPVRPTDERAFEGVLRTAARRAVVPAPPTLTSSVRKSLDDLDRGLASPVARRLAAPRVLAVSGMRQATWRGLGALGLVAVCGSLAMAFAPREMFAALGTTGTLLLSLLALGRLLSAAAGAILAATIPALVAATLYGVLLLLWFRLVRRPVEIS